MHRRIQAASLVRENVCSLCDVQASVAMVDAGMAGQHIYSSGVPRHCIIPGASCALSPAAAMIAKLSDPSCSDVRVPLVANGRRVWPLGSSHLASSGLKAAVGTEHWGNRDRFSVKVEGAKTSWLLY